MSHGRDPKPKVKSHYHTEHPESLGFGKTLIILYSLLIAIIMKANNIMLNDLEECAHSTGHIYEAHASINQANTQPNPDISFRTI